MKENEKIANYSSQYFDELPTDQNIHFRTDHLESDLKARSVRGASVNVISLSVRFALNYGSTIILARILTPQDFGIIAMVWAIIAFAFLFKDLGLSMATIQEAQITHEQVSNLFWINVLFGLGVTIFFIFLSPLVARFYDEGKLKLITVVLSLSYTFAGLAVQHQAILKRQMRFTALAINELSAYFLGVSAAIISACLGAGYWALVIKEVVTSFFRALIIWWLCNWRPKLPCMKVSISRLLAFGRNLTGFNMLNYFSRNLDNVLIGKFLGAQALGFYSKAYQLLLLPVNQISVPIANVAIPSLSRLQNDPDKYRQYYCKTINLASFLTMPLTVALAVLSNEIILVLLGTQWKETGIIFQILAIAAFGQTVSHTTGWIFISLNQTDRMLKWEMFSSPITILSFIVGLLWGVRGVAISYTICSHLLRIFLLPYAFKRSPVKIYDLISAIWRPMIISLLMAPVMFITHHYVGSLNLIIVFFFTILSGIIVMGVTVLILPGAKAEISEFIEIVQMFKSKDTKKKSAQKIR